MFLIRFSFFTSIRNKSRKAHEMIITKFEIKYRIKRKIFNQHIRNLNIKQFHRTSKLKKRDYFSSLNRLELIEFNINTQQKDSNVFHEILSHSEFIEFVCNSADDMSFLISSTHSKSNLAVQNVFAFWTNSVSYQDRKSRFETSSLSRFECEHSIYHHKI